MSEAELTRAEAEASDWFTRLKRTRISRQELYGFRAWRQDPTNAAAFTRVETAWKASKRLKDDPDIQAATAEALQANPLPDRRPRPTVTWRPLGVAVLLAIAAGGIWVASLGLSPSYATRIGEQRLISLDDGSRVRLNTDSAMRIVFNGRERRVELQRGEAYFEVAHDGARPFVVAAGDAQVRALGTKFDVRRSADAVRVVLVQGRVQVAHDDTEGAVILAPNQELDVTARGMSRPRTSDVVEAAGWTTGRLTFRDMALRDAVSEVNRYAARKITLDAPADVAAEPVTGEFDVGDTQAFVTAVSLAFGLTAEPQPDGKIRLVAPTT